MKNIIFGLIVLMTLSACSHRKVKVLDAGWTSMKHSMPPSPQDKLVRANKISEEFCMKSWSGTYGLMDEAIRQAETKHDIDYIKYPSFTQTVGQPCLQISGEGYRIAR